jgi:hypothetical protein
MKTSLASGALVLSFFALTSYACSSSSSTGGSTGGDTDAGTPSSSPDSGGGTTPDSGSPQQSACGTGSFSCNGVNGETTCDIATQYCQDGLGCLEFTDGCTNCGGYTLGECGVGKTANCGGNDQNGITITCE